MAAFIAAVEEWPGVITMSSMLQQRAKLSLANAAMLECRQALPLTVATTYEHIAETFAPRSGDSSRHDPSSPPSTVPETLGPRGKVPSALT